MMTKQWMAAALLCIAGTPAFAQHETHGGGALSPEQVGTVDFQTSCTPAVKTEMNQAVALLHSFWFPEARQAFQAIATKDPACAMAHWGIALTHWGNPFGGLRAPLTALHHEKGVTSVWTVENGAVRLVPVRIVGQLGNDVLLGAGVKAGQTVVTAGVNQLRNGQKVRILSTDVARRGDTEAAASGAPK